MLLSTLWDVVIGVVLIGVVVVVVVVVVLVILSSLVIVVSGFCCRCLRWLS